MGTPSVRVLGELAIDGLETRSLADRKARLVLQLLAFARGRRVSTAALVDALWGESPPARPADQVAVLVSRLRRALGRDSIDYSEPGYRLQYEWLDLDELASVTSEAERRRDAADVGGALAASRVALSLIRGPLPEPVSEADWVLADRAAAVRLIQRARHSAAAAMLDAGEWLDALDVAEADLGANRYDEDAARHVMRAHVLAGRPALALAVYADLRSTLVEDLGADPSSETSDLHEAILRGDVVASSAATAVPMSGVVGRQEQLGILDRLAERVSEGTMRIVVVAGEAGIGKTTLISAWARHRSAAGDIVLFGTCGALDRSAPLDVLLAAIAEHIRRAPDPVALLAEDAPLLAPLLGLAELTVTAGRRAPDPVLGPATLFAAITAVLERIAGDQGVVLVIDDAHLAGPPLAEWASFALRRSPRLLVVAASRVAEGAPFPSTDDIVLGPLGRQETAELVGEERASELYLRSGGHPLFLSELASSSALSDEAIPPSLVASVELRCDQLGSAAGVLRAAAVLGTHLDIDLLASVLGRPTLDVLADAELSESRQFLVDRGGRYAFRHELMREALAAGASPGRAALLHREAGRILAERPTSDPVRVAEHARLGGDLAQAARSLRLAAHRASERFDHATAEALLDQSLALHSDDGALLERARVRTRRGRYGDAQLDVEAADRGAEGYEVGAWAAYFDRRFDDAIQFAHDGEISAADAEIQARCLTVGGRTLHAKGDLVGAEQKLTAAVSQAVGPDRLTAAAWLGVLKSHRSETEDAINLLRPVAHPGAGVDLTSATLHALLFTGHAHALAGRPREAIAAFGHYDAEVVRRQVPRFSGRGVNMSGWVLRNIGAPRAAIDAHQEALDIAIGDGMVEMRIAALEDLAEERLRIDDPEGATALLDESSQWFDGDLVFGWRLGLKLALLRTRIALQTEEPQRAYERATELVSAADQMGVPRYSSVGRLLAHHARAGLGEPVDLAMVHRDLATVEATVLLEAWWLAGQTGVTLGDESLIRRAEVLASDLATASGDMYADGLRAEADRQLAAWRIKMR